MVPFGVAQAGGVLVGQAVGRASDDEARRAAGAAVIVGTGFMAMTAVLLIAFPDALARIYTSDAAVLPLAATLLVLAGVFQIFDGLQVVCAGVLRGVGDTRVPMIVGLVGFWLFGMPTSLWLGLVADLGAIGLWWGLVAGLALVSLFLMIRMYFRLGRHLVRIDVEHETT
jgi:MATE family multidrug resistance protein